MKKSIKVRKKGEVKYYSIPVSSKFFAINGRTFYDILCDNDDSLADREDEYYSYYGEPIFEISYFEEFMEKYQKETKKMFKERGIIYDILLIEDDNGLRDLITNTPVNCTSATFLHLPELERTKEEVDSYIKNNNDYPKKLQEFFKGKKDLEEGFSYKKTLLKNNNLE